MWVPTEIAVTTLNVRVQSCVLISLLLWKLSVYQAYRIFILELTENYNLNANLSKCIMLLRVYHDFLFQTFLHPYKSVYGTVLIDLYGSFSLEESSVSEFSDASSFLRVCSSRKIRDGFISPPLILVSMRASFTLLLSIPRSTRAKAERRNKWSENYSLCESWWVVVGSGTEIRYDFISASRPRYASRASFISFVHVGE